MCSHEIKNCPCCGSRFECKAGSITQCHCFDVQLTGDERALLEREYKDCLCNGCLREYQFGERKTPATRPGSFTSDEPGDEAGELRCR